MHPAWMVASLAVAALALRAGLALRRTRRTGVGSRGGLRRRHLRLAKPAVLMIGIGFGAGILSMAFLRGRTPFGTVHAWVASSVLLLFLATAVLGRRLETGRGRAREAHALLGLLALGLAAVAAVAGFVLLP